MVGLAIDGGGLLFTQRNAQNVADAAVVAATYAKCVTDPADPDRNNKIIAAAMYAAQEEGFVDADGPGVLDLSDGLDIEVNPSPALGADFVTVSITARKQPYFIQVVYGGDLDVSVDAIGRCNIPTTNSAAKALFASCSGAGKNAIHLPGSGNVGSCKVNVIGGIYSGDDADSNQGLCVTGGVTAVGDASGVGGLVDGQPAPANRDSNAIPKEYAITWDLTDFDEATDPYPASIIGRFGTDNYVQLVGGGSYILDTDDMAAGIYDSVTMKANASAEPVLIYADGDIDFNPGSIDQTLYMTVVSPGQIRANGNLDGLSFVNAGDFPDALWTGNGTENKMDHLFWFSTQDDTGKNPPCTATGQTALNWSGNRGTFQGIMFAPQGDVQVSMSDISSPILGCVWGNAINFDIASGTLNCPNDWFPPDPPNMNFIE
jgi:hypothetical protein